MTQGNIVPKSRLRVSKSRYLQRLEHLSVGLHLPEYFPPLLLLMKQRMSRRSSSSTTALTMPMNQPCVAKLVAKTSTPFMGIKRKRRRYGFICACVSGKQERNGSKRFKVKQKNLEQRRGRESIMYFVRVTFHSGYRTTRQTQVKDHFIRLTQLSADKPLKTFRRQRRELEDTLSRIKLYI